MQYECLRKSSLPASMVGYPAKGCLENCMARPDTIRRRGRSQWPRVYQLLPAPWRYFRRLCQSHHTTGYPQHFERGRCLAIYCGHNYVHSFRSHEHRLCANSNHANGVRQRPGTKQSHLFHRTLPVLRRPVYFPDTQDFHQTDEYHDDQAEE